MTDKMQVIYYSKENDPQHWIEFDEDHARRNYGAEKKAIEKLAREEGIQKGRQEVKIDIAKKLKAMGLSIDQIIESTGLSKEEIESL